MLLVCRPTSVSPFPSAAFSPTSPTVNSPGNAKPTRVVDPTQALHGLSSLVRGRLPYQMIDAELIAALRAAGIAPRDGTPRNILEIQLQTVLNLVPSNVDSSSVRGDRVEFRPLPQQVRVNLRTFTLSCIVGLILTDIDKQTTIGRLEIVAPNSLLQIQN